MAVRKDTEDINMKIEEEIVYLDIRT